jgi:2-polyprenyl-3-methyl-5-hydroxy-6-metoxy-1,4-benzoquinol methylase
VEIDFRVASIYDLVPERDAAELVVCCEVLEHLDDPGMAMAMLSKLARSYLLVSVPREPVWRVLNMARGKYLGSFGNTPGHIQHWSRKGFLKMLEEHVDILKVLTPFPWTVALCRGGKKSG